MPPPRLDTQRSVANFADVAGIAGAVSFRLSTGDRNVAAFELERLRFELIERLGKRPHVNARPHCVHRADVKRIEGVLIAVERERDGARFRGQTPGWSRTWSRGGSRWRLRGTRS